MQHLKKMGVLIAGHGAAQTPSSLYWYEQLFAEVQPKSILEIGMLYGTLSVFFGLRCPGATFTTDITDQRPASIRDLHQRLGVSFLFVDERDAAKMRHVFETLARPRFILCDGGDKPAEFAMIAPWLEPGDAIGVHDDGAEFFSDCDESVRIVAVNQLMRWKKDELAADETKLAVWRKL